MSEFSKFPADAPKRLVLKAFQRLGFEIVREAEHIALRKCNPDGTMIPLTLPNHLYIKGSTLRTICRQARLRREDFIRAYYELDV